jgi:Fur family peroxide stress response transcriptional regulator
MQRSTFAQALSDLKSRGVRLTPQRQMILRYLKETHDHPTADEVYNNICQEFSGISMATVYNTLHRLSELGAIRELKYGDGSSRYDGNDSEHAHLVCESCGEVRDVPSPDYATLDNQALRQTGYEIHSFRLEFYGICPSCQEEDKNKGMN